MGGCLGKNAGAGSTQPLLSERRISRIMTEEELAKVCGAPPVVPFRSDLPDALNRKRRPTQSKDDLNEGRRPTTSDDENEGKPIDEKILENVKTLDQDIIVEHHTLNTDSPSDTENIGQSSTKNISEIKVENVDMIDKNDDNIHVNSVNDEINEKKEEDENNEEKEEEKKEEEEGEEKKEEKKEDENQNSGRRRRRTTTTRKEKEEEEVKEEVGEEYFEKWLMDESEWRLEFSDMLGSGTTADVYKAFMVRGEERRAVAVKMLKASGKKIGKARGELAHECEIMSRVQHSNILPFYGCLLKPRLCIVLEYCPRGSLWHVMQEPRFDMTWERTLEWIRQLADGLAAMHAADPPALHRDLKSLNVLVRYDWSLCICDFGLARDDSPDLATLGKMRGTFTYTAPELFLGRRYSPKADIFSLSIICAELLNRCVAGDYVRPYPANMLSYAILMKVAKSNLRPQLPVVLPGDMADLVMAAWDAMEDSRPTAEEFSTRVAAILADYRANSGYFDTLRTDVPLDNSTDTTESDVSDLADSTTERDVSDLADSLGDSEPKVDKKRKKKVEKHLWKDKSLRRKLTSDEIDVLRQDGLLTVPEVSPTISRRPNRASLLISKAEQSLSLVEDL